MSQARGSGVLRGISQSRERGGEITVKTLGPLRNHIIAGISILNIYFKKNTKSQNMLVLSIKTEEITIKFTNSKTAYSQTLIQELNIEPTVFGHRDHCLLILLRLYVTCWVVIRLAKTLDYGQIKATVRYPVPVWCILNISQQL